MYFFNVVKVIFRNQEKQVYQCCHSFNIRLQVPFFSPRKNLEKYKLKKKDWVWMQVERTSRRGLCFRTVLNALCLWSDVGHDRDLHHRDLLHRRDLCPVSESAVLVIESETCVGPSSCVHTALS